MSNSDSTFQELSILDEKLKDDLKRRGKHLDESDLEELLEHYRRQQELLLKKRKAEKSKTDDKLRRKLEEKARKKKVTFANSNKLYTYW